jgi:type II secretory pathway pseudopilin PulG
MRVKRVLDRGETLVELLVAVSIMGVTVVAVVGGLATAIIMSDIHREQARVAAELRSYAAYIDGTATAAYVPCAGSYADTFPLASGFQAEIEEIRYWDGTQFAPSCPATDSGVQQLTLHVSSTTRTNVEERVNLIIRRP